ncbi:MAG: hypothetical protein N4A72_08845 [Bacteroidales bacterium]|nr:hypothetical protein [Bacteroidales bacterium]
MHKVPGLFIIVLMLIVASCTSQPEDCKKLLSEKTSISSILNNREVFAEKIKRVITCEYNDTEIDVLLSDDGMIIDYLFTLFEEMERQSESDIAVSYSEIKQLIDEVMDSEEAGVGESIAEAYSEIMDKYADMATWNEDIELLKEMNFTEYDIDFIKLIIERSGDNKIKYEQVFDILRSYYSTNNTMECPMPSYYDLFQIPHGLDGYFHLGEGLECSKVSNRPALVYFTGHGSINSREFEYKVMSDKEVLRLLNQKYVIIELYVDDRSKVLPEHYICYENMSDTAKHIGEINKMIQEKVFNSNVQPALYIMDSNNTVYGEPYFYDLSVDNFKKFLTNGLDNYYSKIEE